jgi:hypothetical protein
MTHGSSSLSGGLQVQGGSEGNLDLGHLLRRRRTDLLAETRLQDTFDRRDHRPSLITDARREEGTRVLGDQVHSQHPGDLRVIIDHLSGDDQPKNAHTRPGNHRRIPPHLASPHEAGVCQRATPARRRPARCPARRLRRSQDGHHASAPARPQRPAEPAPAGPQPQPPPGHPGARTGDAGRKRQQDQAPVRSAHSPAEGTTPLNRGHTAALGSDHAAGRSRGDPRAGRGQSSSG